MLIATQEMFPSLEKLNFAVLVLFSNAVEPFSIAVYIGGLPATKHLTLWPGKARKTAGIDMVGGPK